MLKMCADSWVTVALSNGVVGPSRTSIAFISFTLGEQLSKKVIRALWGVLPMRRLKRSSDGSRKGRALLRLWKKRRGGYGARRPIARPGLSRAQKIGGNWAQKS